MQRRLIGLMFLGMTLVSALCAADRVNLEVYASKFDSIPVAILKFKPGASTTALTQNEPWKIIADDLAFTTRFSMYRAPRIDSVAFAQRNIALYIDGDYTIVGDNIELNCLLYEVGTKTLILGKKYQAPLSDIRVVAHRYAADILSAICNERAPFFSKIIFVKDEGKTKTLWLMDYDGANQRKVVSNESINIFPAFMDSTRFVWVSYLRGKPDIYKGSLITGKSDIFSYSRYIQTSPTVSPIDGKVAFASSREGNMEIYTCDSDKSNLRRITTSNAIDISPTWSPNGGQLAFTSDRSGSPQIYIMDRDGSNPKRLTFEGDYQDGASWGPKGDYIAYASLQSGKFDVWTIKVDGTSAQQITNVVGSNEYPCWSPDGTHLVFVCTRGGKSDIFSIRANGTDVHQLTTSGNAKMPDWSLTY